MKNVLILEFQRKSYAEGTVWIHFHNSETKVFHGPPEAALEIYRSLKKFAAERSGLPEYQYSEQVAPHRIKWYEVHP